MGFNFLQYFRSHVIAQLDGLITMFDSQTILPLFKIGNRKIVVGRRKIGLEFEGFQVGFDAVFNSSLHQICIGQIGKGLNISKIKCRRFLKGGMERLNPLILK